VRRFTGSDLVLATHNQGKLAEILFFLAPFDLKIVSAAVVGLPEPDETEDSFVGNARIKAHAAASATGLPSLADDSGLCIDALGGDPGVRTADWAETPAGRDFGVAMRRTAEALRLSGANQPWHARFECTLVLAWPDGHDEVFVGSMSGRVVWPIRGADGHGYDPMFQPEGYDLTFGEMDTAQKNQISHRTRAFQKLIAGCFT
jgi:XTP/dITP diphosphohydrolase